MLNNLLQSKMMSTSLPKGGGLQGLMAKLAAKRAPTIPGSMPGNPSRRSPMNMKSALRGVFIKRKIKGLNQPTIDNSGIMG